MSLEAKIFFVKKDGMIPAEAVQIVLTKGERLPRMYRHTYDSSLGDDDVFRKFDPRTDWDKWTGNYNPFIIHEECKLIPRLGMTYLAEPLYSNALNKFPALNLANVEQPTYVQRTRKRNYKPIDWEL